MVSEILPSTRTVGFWSAVLATVFSISYVVGQIAEWMGLMGSGGGAENASTPLHCAADVLPLDDMDRSTLGGDISWSNSVPGYPF